jgi:hypothetical protein
MIIAWKVMLWSKQLVLNILQRRNGVSPWLDRETGNVQMKFACQIKGIVVNK